MNKLFYVMFRVAYVVDLVMAIAFFVGLHFIIATIMLIAAGICNKMAVGFKEESEG